MMKKDSSKSRESNSSSSTNSTVIDYYSPIRRQSDFVEFYSSTSPPNQKSSLSSPDVNSRFSSQNSSILPPKSFLCNSVYLPSNEEKDSSITCQQNAAFLLEENASGGGPHSKNNKPVVLSHEFTLPVKGFDERPETSSLPKSITIGSSDYLKINLLNTRGRTTVGRGTTGLGIIIKRNSVNLATDGKLRGTTYSSSFVRRTLRYRGKIYSRRFSRSRPIRFTHWNSKKLFVLTSRNGQVVVAICAGLNYWYRTIIDQLRTMIDKGVILTPKLCSEEALDVMKKAKRSSNLDPLVDINEAYAEILFGGFVKGEADLYYVNHEYIDRIYAHGTNPNGGADDSWMYGVIGTGGEYALNMLNGCARYLMDSGQTWRNVFVRILAIMRGAIDSDMATGGNICVAQLTDAGVSQLKTYDSRVPFLLRDSINDLIRESLMAGTLKIRKHRRMVIRLAPYQMKRICRPVKIRGFIGRINGKDLPEPEG